MSDSEIRRLEANLAGNPGDLDTRQRLLNAYLRVGRLQPSELLDLAALGDPGAIALTGKTPDLQSRSARFYMRCAWICVLYALSRLPTAETYRQSADEHLSKLLPIIYDAIAVYNTLVEHWLARQITTKDGLPVRYFSPEYTANMLEFSVIFIRLRERFYNLSLREVPGLHDEGTTSTALLFAAMHNILYAYQSLSLASRGTPKIHTDEAIRFAAISIMYSGGDNPWQPGRVSGTLDNYYRVQAQVLLNSQRAQIIQQWLPGYTP